MANVAERKLYMSAFPSEISVGQKLFGEIALSPARAELVRKSYLLLSLSVASAMAGGYLGAHSEFIVGLLSNWIGWVLAMILINVVPRIAIAARHNPVMGISALVLDGFLAGLAISPLLYVALMVGPGMIYTALVITGLVFTAVTMYVMTADRVFSAPRGLMAGAFVAIVAAIVLNAFLNIGFLGIVISAAIGIIGVFTLIYATSDVLHNPGIDSPIPCALMLFAGLFNVFVAVLNILLRLDRR
jgi:modulator of FtsH protease